MAQILKKNLHNFVPILRTALDLVLSLVVEFFGKQEDVSALALSIPQSQASVDMPGISGSTFLGCIFLKYLVYIIYLKVYEVLVNLILFETLRL